MMNLPLSPLLLLEVQEPGRWWQADAQQAVVAAHLCSKAEGDIKRFSNLMCFTYFLYKGICLSVAQILLE